MKNYLFPKFCPNLTIEQLMQLCKELGVDGPTLMVRNGYWCTKDNMKETIPAFVKAAQDAGLEVKYADTPFEMQNLNSLEEEISILKDNGIEKFRLSHMPKTVGNARDLRQILIDRMAIAADVATRHNIQAIVQIHGVMYPHNASTAYEAIKYYNPEFLGLKLDPGNNMAFEGYEFFDYQVELLGDYIAAVGEKDADIIRTNETSEGSKGFARRFVPSQRGMSDYDLVFSSLAKQNINVPGILMPFYDDLGDAFLDNLKEEIQYFKNSQKKAGL